jgi:hypothetical protein
MTIHKMPIPTIKDTHVLFSFNHILSLFLRAISRKLWECSCNSPVLLSNALKLSPLSKTSVMVFRMLLEV